MARARKEAGMLQLEGRWNNNAERSGGIRSIHECLSGLCQRTQLVCGFKLRWVCWLDRWAAPHGNGDLYHTARLRYHARCCAIPIPRIRLSLPNARCTLLGCDRSEEHTSELQSLMRISYD